VPRARRSCLTAAIAAVALTSAIPASASAALPPGRSGFYGGGAVSDYLQFVSLRVQPGGGLAAHATLVTRCAPRFGDRLTENVSVTSARLDDSGRYSAVTPFSHAVEPGVPGIGGLRAEGTIAFSARVLAGGGARGEIRVLSAVGLPLDVVAHRARVRRGRFAVAGDFRRPFTLPTARRWSSATPGSSAGASAESAPAARSSCTEW
jgi:hypothetical protein